MRKFLTFAAVLFFSVVCFAQKDVTKFLGFPVDGSKSEMIKNLKSKGFKLDNVDGKEFLSGRFNGVDVNVYISTEKGKVARIMVCDENTLNATDIKARFNRLCRQFQDNGKYLYLNDYTISENEDISYEMVVRDKRYEATFYQLPEGEAMEQIQASIANDIYNKYSIEQLESNKEELIKDAFSLAYDLMMDSVKNKHVWFMITEFYGKYYITMFYDNEYNRANGEDL